MNHKLAILSVCMLLTASCDSSMEETYSQQADAIDSYVEQQIADHPEYKVAYNDGVVRLTMFEGSGEEAGNGDGISFYFAAYTFSSGNINVNQPLATNIKEIAAAAGMAIDDDTAFEPVNASLKKGDLLDGLRLGLEGAKAGEDCYVLFSGKKGFGKKQVGTINANSPLAFRIQVESIGD